jgi:hypothetical protein
VLFHVSRSKAEKVKVRQKMLHVIVPCGWRSSQADELSTGVSASAER